MEQLSNYLSKGLGLSSSSEATTSKILNEEDAAARTPFWNKGSGFSKEERTQNHLTGLIPSSIETLKQQEERALVMLRKLKGTPLNQYMFLANLRTTNLRLFYTLVINNFKLIAPLIYTPVVGEACLNYSLIQPFLGAVGTPDGLFISINDIDNLDELLVNYNLALPPPKSKTTIAVITDGSRILGLGDLGVNGMGIPVGKLQLYSGAAGIPPNQTLPIALDFGTNTKNIIDDPLYLGVRQKRPDDEEFYAAVDKVLVALDRKFPGILIQFEDFSSDHAFGLLDKYKDKLFCFNDDIQGTGAVILSGVINAIRLSEVKATDHKIVFFGAGSAGIGVASQIMDYFIHEVKLTKEEARKKFWLIDSKGLITSDRGDKLSNQKQKFARDDNEGNQFKTVLEVIEYVKPTALIGLSSISGAFTKEALAKMAEINNRPIVFPLSNPATSAECTFEQAMQATDNRALFASGTAFPCYTDPKTSKVYYPGQGNNMYIFPGLGLGAIIAKCGRVTDKMIYCAATSLADSLTKEELNRGDLYPDLNRIREISCRVAAATIKQANAEGLVKDGDLISIVEDEDTSKLFKFVEEYMWSPKY